MKVRTTFNRNIIKYWLPVVFWMAFIFWMSTETFSSENTLSWIEIVIRFLVPAITTQELDLIHVVIRKAGHITEYFILGLLLIRGFRGDSTSSWNWRRSFFAVMVVGLWAVGDELHQSFVLTRTASALDVAIDTAAGTLAQWVGALWHRYRKK
jgi:VanZ family protein